MMRGALLLLLVLPSYGASPYEWAMYYATKR